MYVRPIHEGRPLSFGVSGKLWRDALIMYDRETGSLWSHVTGTAVSGKLAGTPLKMYPAIQTTWAEWKRLHPTGQVLSKRSAWGYTGTRNAYEDYFADENRLGIFGTQNPDKSLPGKEFVLGLPLGAARVAYPFRHLSRQPVVNDTVDGQPVLVVFSSRDATAVAFSRRLKGKTLTFANLREVDGEWRAEDQETGSTWRALRGEAIEGKLRGASLEPLPAHLIYWFAWKQFYPQTRLWKP